MDPLTGLFLFGLSKALDKSVDYVLESAWVELDKAGKENLEPEDENRNRRESRAA